MNTPSYKEFKVKILSTAYELCTALFSSNIRKPEQLNLLLDIKSMTGVLQRAGTADSSRALKFILGFMLFLVQFASSIISYWCSWYCSVYDFHSFVLFILILLQQNNWFSDICYEHLFVLGSMCIWLMPMNLGAGVKNALQYRGFETPNIAIHVHIKRKKRYILSLHAYLQQHMITLVSNPQHLHFLFIDTYM